MSTLPERLRDAEAPLDDPDLNDEAAAEIERLQADAARWVALLNEIQADIDRPEGRWGMHGHSAVDDDYFCALEYVAGRMRAIADSASQAERA